MNIYAGLLFNQGHVADAATARMLAGVPEPQAPAPDDGGTGVGPGTRAYAAGLLEGRRGHGWVELETVLLALR